MARRRDERRGGANEFLVDIPDSTEVRITNDYNGRYVLKHKSLIQYKISFNEAGSEEWITFKELRAVKNTSPAPFETLRLIITGVRNATKEITITGEDGKTKKKKVPVEIKDVVQALGLSRYYEAHNKMLATEVEGACAPDGIDVEDFIIESSLVDFENVMKSSPSSFKFKIADMAAGLYAQDKFTNRAKIMIIEEVMGSEFFDAIDYAKAYRKGVAERIGIKTW